MNSVDSTQLSDDAKRIFAESSEHYAQKRRLIGLIGVFAALTLTYGMLLWFVFKTVIDALTRA